MSNASDNPLKRFSAFWLGLVLIIGFALLSLIFGWLAPKHMEKSVIAAGQQRSEIRKAIDSEQTVALNAEAVEAAKAEMIKALVSSKPAKGSMVVPSSSAEAATEAPEAAPAEAAGEAGEATPEEEAPVNGAE